MKFTKNERGVLKLLLDNGRISDVDMASKLKISTQAIGKIRKKLEDNGVIEGYSCNLNFERLGINNFAFGFLDVKDKFWEDYGEINGRDQIKNTPHTIMAFIPLGSEASVLTLQGFRNSKEMDRYFHIIETRHREHNKFNRVYSFSPLNFLKNNSNELFKLILDNKPIIPEKLNRESK